MAASSSGVILLVEALQLPRLLLLDGEVAGVDAPNAHLVAVRVRGGDPNDIRTRTKSCFLVLAQALAL